MKFCSKNQLIAKGFLKACGRQLVSFFGDQKDRNDVGMDANNCWKGGLDSAGIDLF